MELNKQLKTRVVRLLTCYPHLRDSDEKLIANIWHEDLNLSVNNMTAFEFLHQYSCGKLTAAESIRRTRQLVQSEMPELRGAKYSEKQKYSGEVKKQLAKMKE